MESSKHSPKISTAPRTLPNSPWPDSFVEFVSSTSPLLPRPISTTSTPTAGDILGRRAASPARSPDEQVTAPVTSSMALPVASFLTTSSQAVALSSRSRPVERAKAVANPVLATLTQPPATSTRLLPFILPATRFVDSASSVASVPSFHSFLDAVASSTPTSSSLAAICVPHRTSVPSPIPMNGTVNMAFPKEYRSLSDRLVKRLNDSF